MTAIQPTSPRTTLQPTQRDTPDAELKRARPRAHTAPVDGYVRAEPPRPASPGPIARDRDPLPTEAKAGNKKKGFFGRALQGIGDFFARGGEALSTVVTSAVQTVTSGARNVVEGLGRAGRAFGMIFRGQVGKGLGELGLSVLDMTLGTATDGLLFLGAKGLSAIQTLTFLEPRGRKLTAEEIATLREVYGDSIDYSKIRLKEGFAGVASANDRPFTLGDTVYLKDFAADDDLLVHEVAHVWQFQNGGTDYMRESLVSQVNGHGYDWQSSVPDTPWSELEPEQQAELLEDSFQAGFFEHGTFVVHYDGQTRDLTAYMQSVMGQVRAGEGAP